MPAIIDRSQFAAALILLAAASVVQAAEEIPTLRCVFPGIDWSARVTVNLAAKTMTVEAIDDGDKIRPIGFNGTPARITDERVVARIEAHTSLASASYLEYALDRRTLILTQASLLASRTETHRSRRCVPDAR